VEIVSLVSRELDALAQAASQQMRQLFRPRIVEIASAQRAGRVARHRAATHQHGAGRIKIISRREYVIVDRFCFE
jgi:hypothetical protein